MLPNQTYENTAPGTATMGGVTKSTEGYLGGIARNHLHTATPGAESHPVTRGLDGKTLTGISEPGAAKDLKPMSAEGMSSSVYSQNNGFKNIAQKTNVLTGAASTSYNLPVIWAGQYMGLVGYQV